MKLRTNTGSMKALTRKEAAAFVEVLTVFLCDSCICQRKGRASAALCDEVDELGRVTAALIQDKAMKPPFGDLIADMLEGAAGIFRDL